MGEFVTLRELSIRTGLTEWKIRDLAKSQGLPLYRLDSHLPPYGFWTEIEQWLKKHRKPAYRVK